jgi:hypothetical protein
VGDTSIEGPVCPLIAVPIPGVPWNHWYETVPVATTLSVVELPELIDASCGCAVIAGGSHTVTVAALLVTDVLHALTTT